MLFCLSSPVTRRDEIALFPSPVLLPTVIEAARGSNVAVGAQNIHFAEEGAYTGETSADQLIAVGGTHTLIGHSERRQYFAETDEIVNKKLHTALKHGIVPVVCIGEVLAEREAGQTENVLKTQITGAFAGIKGLAAEVIASIVIAYEPVWAIGTGKTATPEMAVDAHRIIRAEVASLLGAEVAGQHAHPLRRQREARQRHRAHRPGRDRRRTGGRRQPQARLVHGHREVLADATLIPDIPGLISETWDFTLCSNRLAHSCVSWLMPETTLQRAAGEADSTRRLSRASVKFYIDRLRSVMTAFVILHHTAITYGAIGGWFWNELKPSRAHLKPAADVFCATNQAYFMGFFFLLAGYFTPGSLERKGYARFHRRPLHCAWVCRCSGSSWSSAR